MFPAHILALRQLCYNSCKEPVSLSEFWLIVLLLYDGPSDISLAWPTLGVAIEMTNTCRHRSLRVFDDVYTMCGCFQNDLTQPYNDGHPEASGMGDRPHN